MEGIVSEGQRERAQSLECSLTELMGEAERERKRENQDITDQERYVASEEQLLPNMSDQITLHVICLKLPWSTFRSFSSVSTSWRRAIHRGEFYPSRVLSHSAQKFAVINQPFSRSSLRLRLYSFGGGDHPQCRKMLPPIPQMDSGIPLSCECIALDGKLYILEGLKDPRTQLGSANVYMLNMYSLQWRKCASMHSPRQKFRAGVVDGKIYVCGGSSLCSPVCGTEVYDPEADAWTGLTPMPSALAGHNVEVVDGELFVFGGRCFQEHFRAIQEHIKIQLRTEARVIPQTRHNPEAYYTDRLNHVEVYNPEQNEWRQLPLKVPAGSRWNPDDYLLFMADRTLHSISGNDISVFDLKNLSWTFLCSMSDENGLGVPLIDRRISESISGIQVLEKDVLVRNTSWYGRSIMRLDMPIGLQPGTEVDRTPRNCSVIERDLGFPDFSSPFICILEL